MSAVHLLIQHTDRDWITWGPNCISKKKILPIDFPARSKAAEYQSIMITEPWTEHFKHQAIIDLEGNTKKILYKQESKNNFFLDMRKAKKKIKIKEPKIQK